MKSKSFYLQSFITPQKRSSFHQDSVWDHKLQLLKELFDQKKLIVKDQLQLEKGVSPMLKNDIRASRDFIIDNYENEKTRRDAAMVKKITFLNKSVIN